LGQVGYDFASEARLDSFVQRLAAQAGAATAERVFAFDSRRLLEHLNANPSEAAALEWTLLMDGYPVYVIRPYGPFAAEIYALLRTFLRDRLEEGVERVSIPGYLAGKRRLLMGQMVPVIVPELRGMFSWTTAALVERVVGRPPAARAAREQHERRRAGVHNFLQRIYHESRNLGLLPQERALNFAATNAFSVAQVYEEAMREEMELESIQVARSPICRPESDCWDVEVYFFYPQRQVQTVRRVYRFTVDVSDVVPVTVGPVRNWSTR
jgi:cyanobactin maturation PatA/PatG family protease